MSPSFHRSVPLVWRFEFIGALDSLPITVLVNWLPNSEANITGDIMIFGAFIGEVIATIRSTDPDAAGLRAGLLGGIIGILTPFVMADNPAIETMVTWRHRPDW